MRPDLVQGDPQCVVVAEYPCVGSVAAPHVLDGHGVRLVTDLPTGARHGPPPVEWAGRTRSPLTVG